MTDEIDDSKIDSSENDNQQIDASQTILTERELEILSLVLNGKSSKESADILCCSKKTVDFHLSKIYSKLQVSNRVQAIRTAASLGLFNI